MGYPDDFSGRRADAALGCPETDRLEDAAEDLFLDHIIAVQAVRDHAAAILAALRNAKSEFRLGCPFDVDDDLIERLEAIVATTQDETRLRDAAAEMARDYV